MKKLVQVQEVEGEGLVSLLGEKVLLICGGYFYAGVLSGVNKDCVKLDNAFLVYETGPWNAAKWTDAQSIGPEVYVQTASIEAFFKSNK